MYRARAHITDDGRPSRSDLALDVKVPVQNQGTFRVLLNIPIPDSIWGKTNVVIDTGAQRYSIARIDGAVALGGGPSGLILADDLERRSCGRIQAKLVGKR